MSEPLLALVIVGVVAAFGLFVGWLLFLAIRPHWDATRAPARRAHAEAAFRAAEVRAAEQRWRQYNADARAAGCPCGRPATEVVYDPRVMGSVPHETWTCLEHVGVEMWSGGRPAWAHDREVPGQECWGSSGPIGGPPNRWYYPVKPKEVAR